jgi:hypothetical protein
MCTLYDLVAFCARRVGGTRVSKLLRGVIASPPLANPSGVATAVAALVVDEQHEWPKRVVEPEKAFSAAGGTGRYVGRDYTGRVAARQSSTRDQSGRGFGHETARNRKRRSLRSGPGAQNARVEHVEPDPAVLRTKRTALPPRFQVSAHRVAFHNRQLAPLHLCDQEALRVVRVRRDQVEFDAPLPVPFDRQVDFVVARGRNILVSPGIAESPRVRSGRARTPTCCAT